MNAEHMAVFPSLKGKVAAVTGAGSGIGQATAVLLAKNGAKLFLMSRREEKLQETQELCAAYGAECHYLSTDVTKPEEIAQAFARCFELYGRIDILINDAGGSTGRKTTFEMTAEDFDAVYRLNLRNVFLCCKEVLDHMKERGCGRIVNVSSLIGRAAGENTNVAYSSMKAGIDQFTKYLAREVGRYGIAVNSVAPGYIAASQRILDLWATSQDMDSVFQRLSIKRAGTSMETANAIVFLASDEAGYITGETIDVNGGAIMA